MTSGPSGCVVLATAGGLRATLDLKLIAATPMLDERRAAAAEVENRVRSACLEAIEKSDAYRRLCDLRPQYRAAVAAAQAAEEALKKAEGRKAALVKATPPPKQLASRLVAVQAEIDQAAAARLQAYAERDALAPLYRQAEADLSDAAGRAGQAAHRAAWESSEETLREAVTDLLAFASEKITRVALLFAARRTINPATGPSFGRDVVAGLLRESEPEAA
jgi:hypothetical protein